MQSLGNAFRHETRAAARPIRPIARCVNEFTFRLNEGNVAHHTMKRLESLVKGAIGKRLTYQRLIAK